jgi:hypothetical protein
MKIRVSDSGLAPALVSALNETDCAAALTAADTIDVFLPWPESEHGEAGAHASAELVFFVRAWELQLGGLGFEAEVA